MLKQTHHYHPDVIENHEEKEGVNLSEF